MTDVAALETEIANAIAGVADEAALEAVRVGALGRNGTITALLKTLGGMTPDQRKVQ
jgi:phenylalanyl-tRNA synthetase alpha chain